MKSFSAAKLIASAIVIFVFIADFLIPIGFSVGVLYLIALPVLILEKKKTVLLFAFSISIMILLNLFYFATPSTPFHIYINRFFAVLSVAVISYVLIRYKILKDRNEGIKEAKRKTLEELLFMTNHKVRRPIATLSGISQVIESSGFSEEEKEQVVQLMQKPIHELEKFTKELTALIEIKNV